MAIVSRSSPHPDIEIKCCDKIFLAHKVVVLEQSQRFRRLCENGSENFSKVSIEDNLFDPSTIDRMLDFMYANKEQGEQGSPPFSADKPDPTDALMDTVSQLLAYVHLYSAADHYVVLNLKAFAIKRFRALRTPDITLTPTGFITVILAVYNATRECNPTSDLRKTIVDMSLENKDSLLTDTGFLAALWTQHDLQEFAVDFMMGIHALYSNEQATLKDMLEVVMEGHAEQVASLQEAHKVAVEKSQVAHAAMSDALKSERAESEQKLASAQQESLEKLNKANKLLHEEHAKRKDVGSRSKELSDELATVKRGLATAKAEPSVNQIRVDTLQSVIQQMKELNQIKQCRNFKRDFEYNFERYGPNGYLARCIWDGCGCRHFAGCI